MSERPVRSSDIRADAGRFDRRLRYGRKEQVALLACILRLLRRSQKESTMLSNTDAVANLAVKNLDTAKKFYKDTVGLTPIGAEGDEAIVFKSGSSKINVYRSKYAGTNQATAVTWNVGNRVDDVVRDLKEKGVKFEHYNLPGMTLQGDIHVAGQMRTAWFKDPDGNILNIVNV
jgi:catechol 2,3-dioxygenase-like lactoylglutathione lyase family enzyme